MSPAQEFCSVAAWLLQPEPIPVSVDATITRNWPIAAVTRDCNRLMTEKLFVMELIPSGVFDDLPIELNVWPTRLSEILDMSLSIILFFECG
jgi:hypothetical protein